MFINVFIIWFKNINHSFLMFNDFIYNYWLNTKLFNYEEFIILWLMFNFFQLLLVCILNELLWPSQFFNRRHNTGYQLIKYRTYTDTINKLVKNKRH